MRIGINLGPVVAGIIGTHKFAYDLWGDVVDTASRMESERIEGSIQVSETTYDLIKNEYTCEERGKLQEKGKGVMQTYLLLSRKAQTSLSRTRP
jgi:class 3 adenylate cyclase